MKLHAGKVKVWGNRERLNSLFFLFPLLAFDFDPELTIIKVGWLKWLFKITVNIEWVLNPKSKIRNPK